MIANVYGTRHLSPAAEKAFAQAYLKFREKEAPEIFTVPKNSARSAKRMPAGAPRKRCRICHRPLCRDTQGDLCRADLQKEKRKKADKRARDVKRLRDQGYPHSAIAKKLGLTISQSENACAHYRRAARKRQARLAQSLARDGWTADQIARDLNISQKEAEDALRRR